MKSKSVASARRQAVMVAVVLTAALTATPTQATPGTEFPRELADISRYCQACWRNARLPVDSWADCTQEVFARLLERVEFEQWRNVLQVEGEERREFLRAIDAVKKRTQRGRKFVAIGGEVPSRSEKVHDEWETIDTASSQILSVRQQRILTLSREGWSIAEIADELNTTVERVSDEKYKAIRKLRRHLSDKA